MHNQTSESRESRYTYHRLSPENQNHRHPNQPARRQGKTTVEKSHPRPGTGCMTFASRPGVYAASGSYTQISAYTHPRPRKSAGTDRTVMLARPLKTERTLTHAPSRGTRTVRRSRRDVTLCHCHWHAYHTHRSRFFTVHAFAFRGLALCPRAAPLRNDAPAARPWHRHGLGAWSRGMVSSGAERLR